MSQNLNTNRNVIITGATGFIGGITTIELKRHNYKVFGVDRVERNHLNEYFDEFYCGDFIDYESFLLIKRVNPIAIIHCAGTSLVGPSHLQPGAYFHNNVSRTNLLLDFLRNNLPKTKFIFSSSAAVYGAGYRDWETSGVS